MTAAITLKKLSKNFASRALFKNVTASFAAGAVHLVVGRNGSGKSTLLRMIGGLVRPSSGEIAFAHEDVLIGYLGHATFLYPNLTARENLLFWQRAYKQPASEKDVLAMLARVGLAPFADTRAGVFSRGMTQRLSLARVLLLQPGICLFDEPETGLDTASRDMLHTEIARAAQRGACVLWVSHLAARTELAGTVPVDAVYEVKNKGLVLHKGTRADKEPAHEAACPAEPAKEPEQTLKEAAQVNGEGASC